MYTYSFLLPAVEPISSISIGCSVRRNRKSRMHCLSSIALKLEVEALIRLVRAMDKRKFVSCLRKRSKTFICSRMHDIRTARRRRRCVQSNLRRTSFVVKSVTRISFTSKTIAANLNGCLLFDFMKKNKFSRNLFLRLLRD